VPLVEYLNLLIKYKSCFFSGFFGRDLRRGFETTSSKAIQ